MKHLIYLILVIYQAKSDTVKPKSSNKQFNETNAILFDRQISTNDIMNNDITLSESSFKLKTTSIPSSTSTSSPNSSSTSFKIFLNDVSDEIPNNNTKTPSTNATVSTSLPADTTSKTKTTTTTPYSSTQFIDEDFFTRSFQLPRIKYRKLNHTDEPQQIASLLQMANQLINTVFVPFDQFEPFLISIFQTNPKLTNSEFKSKNSTSSDPDNNQLENSSENNTEFDSDTDNDLPTSNSTESGESPVQFSFSDFTAAQSGYFVCLIVGVIYAMGVPLISLIICILRLKFHKCGGIPMQDVSVSRSHWRYTNCLVQACLFI